MTAWTREEAVRTVGRRRLLTRSSAGGAAMAVAPLLSACGGTKPVEKTQTLPSDKSVTDKLVKFSNWSLYSRRRRQGDDQAPVDRGLHGEDGREDPLHGGHQGRRRAQREAAWLKVTGS